MHIYFVRHGETLLNRAHVHQSPTTLLSEKGKEQAREVGEMLREMNPDHLITSEYVRAKETATIIGECVGLTPIIHEDFYEIIRPSSLHGKSHFHPKSILYAFLTIWKYKESEWHFEDAENVTEMRARAQRALQYLESCVGKQQSIVVVSHTIFIHGMVSYMCKKHIWGILELLLTALHVKQMKNTGIIHVEYTGAVMPHTCAWRTVEGV